MSIDKLSTARTKLVQGKSFLFPYGSLASGSTTAATASSGHINYSLSPNTVGSTLPSTIVGFPQSTNTASPIRFFNNVNGLASISIGALCYIYLIGTVNLAATGDQFTHDAATFPLTRTWFNTTVNIPLVPIIQTTTATTTTAPILRLRTNAGGTGYKNQDNSTIVGAKTLTYPNVATAVNSGFHLPIEDNDSSVLDIAAIEITTASSTGAANIWGIEVLSPQGTPSALLSMNHNAITGSLSMQNLQPATATSGTVTSYLTNICFDNASRLFLGFLGGILDA